MDAPLEGYTAFRTFCYSTRLCSFSASNLRRSFSSLFSIALPAAANILITGGFYLLAGPPL
jgi:hypothetical protein